MLVRISKNPRAARRGVVITPWMMVGMSVIIGVVAIGMDGGRMLQTRRHAQAAADAAALAGAAQLYLTYWTYQGQDSSGTANSAALQAASANSYNNDGVTNTVTVNIPPQAGAFAGQAGYIEVIVQRNLSGTFGAIFTGRNLTVKARAVARGRALNIGIIALQPTGDNGFVNNTTVAFAVLNSPIFVNSTDNNALVNKNTGLLAAQSYEIVGGFKNQSGGIVTGPVHTGVPPTPDPLITVPAPSGGTVRSASKMTVSGLAVLNPGVYQGGLAIQGAASVFMLPGIYIMDGGGFSISNLAAVVADQVIVYNTSITKGAGPININSTGAIASVPPTSGTYQGICIFQDRSLNQPLQITGNGVTSLLGTIYAPAAPVTLTGLATVGLDSLGAYVCSSLQVGGLGNINITLGSNYPRAPDIHLAE